MTKSAILFQLVFLFIFQNAQAFIDNEATLEELNGMAALNCSGALIDVGGRPQDNAVILTNGHCARQPFLKPNEVVTNIEYNRTPIKITAGKKKVTIQSARVLYATMHQTDLALIELDQTNGDLADLGAKFSKIAEYALSAGTEIRVTSGYWREKQDCKILYFVDRLNEGDWRFTNSQALSEGCKVRGGYSGSPIFNHADGLIIGVVNTVNDGSDKACAVNNPCEDHGRPEPVSHLGRGYGQDVSAVNSCFDSQGKFNLSLPSCKLPK
ncbi:MAG: serine protease [Pseudomonadota bacterium]